ncbi:MAG: hypothetical protein HY093_01160 [Candidatus Liptonbacteria bacterium]|nr:hypothetical protein [Candidatus Liptonbacteria bacterium]
MAVEFRIMMLGPVIGGETFDLVVIEWEEERDELPDVELNSGWLTDPRFLTKRMTGLSSLHSATLSMDLCYPH